MPPKPIPPELKCRMHGISLPPGMAEEIVALSPRGSLSEAIRMLWKHWTFTHRARTPKKQVK